MISDGASIMLVVGLGWLLGGWVGWLLNGWVDGWLGWDQLEHNLGCRSDLTAQTETWMHFLHCWPRPTSSSNNCSGLHNENLAFSSQNNGSVSFVPFSPTSPFISFLPPSKPLQ